MGAVPSQHDVRQAMVALLESRSIPRDELIAAVSNDAQIGSPTEVTSVAERLLQLDMAFAEIDAVVCYTPALVDATSWTIPVGADDIERGFVPMHPAWAPLGWWLVTSGAELVDDDGQVIGQITSDGAWLSDDDPDVDVVLGPPGWLDAAVDGWMTVSVRSEQLRVTGCETPPTATPRQIAAVRAGFERTIEVSDATLFDGAHAELATTTSDQVVLAALLSDRDAFVEAPVPCLPDLLDAAGFEQRRHTVAKAGFDWEALDERRNRNHLQFVYGLDENKIDALQVLTGACVAFSEEGDTALGDTDDERDGAAVLMAGLAGMDGVAEAFVTEASLRGVFGDRLEAFVDSLTSRLDGYEPDGLGWITSRCLLDRAESRAAVELVERLAGPDCTLAPLLVDAAGIASDRGDARAAMRLLARAGFDESRLYTDEWDDEPLGHYDDEAINVLMEVAAYARHRPKALVGRNERCPCGSGRKYKVCHLGNERHELGDRSAWLYDKAKRYVRNYCPEILTDLADELAEGSYRIRQQLISSPFVYDLALHENGVFEAFLEDRGWLLPDDEVMLAQTWTLTDRGVFEIIGEHDDELRLRDVGRGETITVTNTYGSDSTRPGMFLVGRPVPVGDTHRAFGGFFPVAPQVVNPLIDALAGDDLDDVMALLASVWRPPIVRNTSGEELAFHAITWTVDDPEHLPDELASAGFEAEGDDRWTLTRDTPGMNRAIIATLRFDADAGTLASETNSDERAAHVKELVAATVPSVRLIDDERREFDEGLDDGGQSGELDQNDPEVRSMLDQVIRAKEIEWLDQQIPALAGRTPREAVGDPVGREDVRRLLASFPEPAPDDVTSFRASRLRAHLGLDD